MDHIGADLLVLILRNTPLGFVACVCRLVCKDWCAVISTGRAPLFWRRASYVEFTREITPLPTCYRVLLADGTWTIDFAWEALRLYTKSDITREFLAAEGFVTDDQWKTLSIMWGRHPRDIMDGDDDDDDDDFALCMTFKTHVLIAIREKLITVDQCLLAGRFSHLTLSALNATAGPFLAVLREKHFTFEELASVPWIPLLYLFDDKRCGLEAIREGFITARVLTYFSCESCTVCCTLERAVNAMRQGWFPWTYFETTDNACYVIERIFLDDNPLADAIRDGVIAWDSIADLNSNRINTLIDSPLAIEALRKRLVALDELVSLSNAQIKETFGQSYVLSLLSSDYVTIKEIAQLTEVSDIEPFLRTRLRKKIRLEK